MCLFVWLPGSCSLHLQSCSTHLLRLALAAPTCCLHLLPTSPHPFFHPIPQDIAAKMEAELQHGLAMCEAEVMAFIEPLEQVRPPVIRLLCGASISIIVKSRRAGVRAP